MTDHVNLEYVASCNTYMIVDAGVVVWTGTDPALADRMLAATRARRKPAEGRKQ